MNKYNEQDLLSTISDCVRDHIQNKMHKRLSTLSDAIGVSHPTSSKILYPEKDNAGGVALKHWLSTLAHCDMLGTFMKEIESKAKAWHFALPPNDLNDPEEALQRLTHLANSFIKANHLNTNNLGCLLDVSHNTAKAMMFYGDSSGGVAIKSWLKLLNIMEVNKDLENTFTKNLSNDYRNEKIAPRSFDLRAHQLVY
ncbi:hypothetical protein ACI2KR_07165 [Pseudomonas luteola]